MTNAQEAKFTSVLTEDEIRDINAKSQMHFTSFARNLEIAILKKMEPNFKIEESFHRVISAALKAGWVKLDKPISTDDEFAAVAGALCEIIPKMNLNISNQARAMEDGWRAVLAQIKNLDPEFDKARDAAPGVTLIQYVVSWIALQHARSAKTKSMSEKFQTIAKQAAALENRVLEHFKPAPGSVGDGASRFAQAMNAVNDAVVERTELKGKFSRLVMSLTSVNADEDAMQKAVAEIIRLQRIEGLYEQLQASVNRQPRKADPGQSALILYVTKDCTPSKYKADVIQGVLREHDQNTSRETCYPEWLLKAVHNMYLLGCADGYDDCRIAHNIPNPISFDAHAPSA